MSVDDATGARPEACLGGGFTIKENTKRVGLGYRRVERQHDTSRNSEGSENVFV